MNSSEHQTTQVIVGNFLREFLNQQGYNWIPPVYSATGVSSGNDRTNTLVPNATERRIIDAISSASVKLSASFNQLLNQTTRETAAANLNYESYAAIADELFSHGIEWSHIVTLFTFSAKLAITLVANGGLRSSSGVLSESQTFNMLYNWLVKYISSNVSVTIWIRSHGSWNGFIEYANSLSPPPFYTSLIQKLLPFSNSLKPIYAISASVASIAAIAVLWMVNKDGLLYKK